MFPVRLKAVLVLLLTAFAVVAAAPAHAAPVRVAADQVLTWTADDDITRYKSVTTQAVAGSATIVFENSAATGNTTGMPHTLTFDTSTAGYNHDVNLNILSNPFDANGGRNQATVTFTPDKYRFFCSMPGHSLMVGELTVTDGGGPTDTTPPTVAGTVAGDRDSDGNYVGSATVTVTATDADSGVGSVEYQVDDTSYHPYTAPVVVSAEGDHSVQFRATDNAGNLSAVGSVSFRVVESGPAPDTTPPTVTSKLAGDQDDDGNYVGSATATLTATDTESGVARVEYSLDGAAFTAYANPVVVNAVGMHMLHYRATDVAGNTSAEQMAHFVVVAEPTPDTTPPTVTTTVAGDRDGAGAYLDVATVTVTATDTESAIAKVEYSVDAGAWTRYTAPVPVRTIGSHAVKYRASDAAGNTSAEESVTFSVVASGSSGECDDNRATVVIDGDDTLVPNKEIGGGCTINDLIDQHGSYADHAAFVRHVESVTASLVTGGTLTARQQGTIVRAAARSDIGS